MDSRGALHKPHFFKVLLPGFETQLQLPRGFVKKHITKEDEKSGMATLSCPNGKVLHVSLHKNQQDLYFSGDKWRACAQLLNLKVGYFLLFSYEANMLFNFIVFGLSNCEKAYLPPPTHVSSETPVAKKSTATCRDGHCFEVITQSHGPITSCCKDCKCARFEAIVSNGNLTKSQMRIPLSFLEVSGLSVEHDKLFLVDSEERSWLVTLRHVGAQVKGGYDTHMGLGWSAFAHDNQLSIGDKCVYELEAGEKDVMQVQILKASPPSFVSNFQSPGAYPLPASYPQSQLTHVSAKTVTAPVAAKMSKTCKNDHQFQIVCQYGGRGSITSVCKVCMCARFEARVSPTNLSPYNHMRIPLAFVELSKLSKEHDKMTLVDPTGRSWPIGFGYWQNNQVKMGYNAAMQTGWKQFKLDNQLGLGDRCVFDLESGEKDIMQVRVLKA